MYAIRSYYAHAGSPREGLGKDQDASLQGGVRKQGRKPCGAGIKDDLSGNGAFVTKGYSLEFGTVFKDYARCG